MSEVPYDEHKERIEAILSAAWAANSDFTSDRIAAYQAVLLEDIRFALFELLDWKRAEINR